MKDQNNSKNQIEKTNKIVIDKKENYIDVFVYQNQKLVEQYKEQFDEQRLESNIYLGKVNNVIKGMQAAFIDIGIEKKALIHIKDCIPKESDITGNENADMSKYSIEKTIKPNQKIIVQIKRDCNKSKGPIVTKDIKLVGKYVILMPFSKFVTISKKVDDKEERKKLIECVSSFLQGDHFGAIIRTSSVGKNEDIIKSDIDELIEKWNDILKKADNTEAPVELYNNNGIIGKLINDFEPLGVTVSTNSKEIKEYIEELDKNIEVEIDKTIDLEIEQPRKIWLKSGGFITIDITEALVAIDVNSGKSTAKSGIRSTALEVNYEAVSEIAKQIRLRDLGGIIIIDFIDMNEQEQEKIIQKMQEEIRNDRSKIQISEFTKLGLLELTRKHIFGR